MQKIREDIYDALLVTPVTVYPQGAVDSLGDTTELPPLSYLGYIYESTEKVLNAEGTEVLSNMQIYLRGDDAESIPIDSLISCLEANRQRIISKQVYRGRNGARVIGVLYLP